MTESLRRKGLGRGLAALMEDVAPPEGVPPRPAETSIPIDRIRPNPEQPRKRFDETELAALAESIRAKGVVQPLILRRDPQEAGIWQIVAGERRWRAAQRVGLHELPAVIREIDDAEAVELAVLENVQRADLNPIEEASGYATLIDRFGHTQQRLADAMGKSRSHIANSLRLLTLPTEVRALVQDGALTAGHARALITAPDPVNLAKRVVEKGLSVRETEQLAKLASPPAGPRPPARIHDPDTQALESDLSAAVDLPVAIRHKGSGGELVIRYRDLDQLDGLCRLLMR